MSMKEPRSIRTSQDWSVVFQSIPSKHKNAVGKQIEDLLGLDKRDAKAILTNAPLVFLDNLSFELAVRIKTYFQKLGVVVEVTNHDIIKKNCSHVSWPKAPDLSFFEAEGTVPVVSPTQKENEKRESVGILLTRKKSGDPEMTPETQNIHVTPPPAKPAHEPQVITPPPEAPSTSDIDVELERRAQEMGERFGTLHGEMQTLRTQHAEAIDALRNESQRRVDEEKKKSEKITKAYEDLQQEVRKYAASSQDGEALRSRAATLDEKVRELDAALKEKSSAVEILTQQKEELARQSEKAAADTRQEIAALRNREPELLRKIAGLEQTVQQITMSLRTRDGALAQTENRLLELEAVLKEKTSESEILIRQKEELRNQSGKTASEAQQELAAFRNREPELLRKIAGLEQTVQQLTASLRFRDSALAQFEEQVTKLIEMSTSPSKKAN